MSGELQKKLADRRAAETKAQLAAANERADKLQLDLEAKCKALDVAADRLEVLELGDVATLQRMLDAVEPEIRFANDRADKAERDCDAAKKSEHHLYRLFRKKATCRCKRCTSHLYQWVYDNYDGLCMDCWSGDMRMKLAAANERAGAAVVALEQEYAHGALLTTERDEARAACAAMKLAIESFLDFENGPEGDTDQRGHEAAWMEQTERLALAFAVEDNAGQTLLDDLDRLREAIEAMATGKLRVIRRGAIDGNGPDRWLWQLAAWSDAMGTRPTAADAALAGLDAMKAAMEAKP